MAVFEKHPITGAWIPTPLARGPFAGLQGGAVAGLLTAELEALAVEEGLGRAVSAAAWFLRPAPDAPLRTRPSLLHARGRLSVLDNALFADGSEEPCALVRLTVLAGRPAAVDLPPATVTDFDPTKLRERRTAAPHGGPWFMDAMEARVADTGESWFRLRVPVVDGAGALALALGPADWAHGLARPLQNVLADPNPNLTVHLLRPPCGEWIGLRAATQWAPAEGAGVGRAVLLDEAGEIGAVSMAVALTPFPRAA
jgi:acyl-coenzyme A thioesterase PaaI-like protein